MMKHLKKTKLGIALENAIIFMMITFSLCALLASLVLLGDNYARLSSATFLDRVALSQAIESGSDNDTYTVNKENNAYWIIEKDGTPVLYIQKNGSAITYRGTEPPQ